MESNLTKSIFLAMLSFMFSGVYFIVDGIFVGNAIGDYGLAAISVSYALPAFLTAIGTGLGMGGAVQISLAMGHKESQKEQGILGNSIVLLIVTSVTLTGVLLLFLPFFLRFLGARGEILKLAEIYGRILIGGSVFQVLSNGIIPILRNYGKSVFVTVIMICGFLTNIAFDALLIFGFNMGIAGAAWATLLGQAVTAIPCIIAVVRIIRSRGMRKTIFKPVPKLIKLIVSTGVSPFGTTMMPEVLVVLFNKAAFTYGGNDSVAAYAIIGYTIMVAEMLLQGVGHGSQPLMSYSHGARDYARLKQITKTAFCVSVITSLVSITLLFTGTDVIARFFGASANVALIVKQSYLSFLVGLFFMAFIQIFPTYFYATEKGRYASWLIYSEPVIMAFLIFIIGLPKFFGITGVWMSLPITRFLLLILSASLYIKRNRTLMKMNDSRSLL